MVLLYPAVLVAAALIVARRPRTTAGWRWFGAWSAAGALMTFSFVTGFSIGIFLLPVAAFLVLLVARRAPNALDATGFVFGLGAVVWSIGLLNSSYSSWLIPGIVVSACALFPYAAARSGGLRRERG